MRALAAGARRSARAAGRPACARSPRSKRGNVIAVWRRIRRRPGDAAGAPTQDHVAVGREADSDGQRRRPRAGRPCPRSAWAGWRGRRVSLYRLTLPLTIGTSSARHASARPSIASVSCQATTRLLGIAEVQAVGDGDGRGADARQVARRLGHGLLRRRGAGPGACSAGCSRWSARAPCGCLRHAARPRQPGPARRRCCPGRSSRTGRKAKRRLRRFGDADAAVSRCRTFETRLDCAVRLRANCASAMAARASGRRRGRRLSGA